jgi:hypothetical protein
MWFDDQVAVISGAGIVRDAAFEDMTADRLEPLLDVHLKRAFNVTGPAPQSWRTSPTDGYRWLAAKSAACWVIPFTEYEAWAKLGRPPGSPLQMVSPSAQRASVLGAYSGPMVTSGAP